MDSKIQPKAVTQVREELVPEAEVLHEKGQPADYKKAGFQFLDVHNTLWPNLGQYLPKMPENPDFVARMEREAGERNITAIEHYRDLQARIEARKFVRESNATAEESARSIGYVHDKDEIELTKMMAPFEELCHRLAGGNVYMLFDQTRVLERLYRLNILNAKTALLAQYLRMATSKSEVQSGDKYIKIDNLALRDLITRHTTAIAEYKAFMDSNVRYSDMYPGSVAQRLDATDQAMFSEMAKVAATTIGVEKFRAWLKTSDLSEDQKVKLRDNAFNDLRYAKESLITGLDEIIDELNENRAQETAEEEDLNQVEEGARRFLARLSMAIIAGLALIAPTLIMVLHADTLTSLLTTSVFVLVVGAALALFVNEADVKDIAGATAAYAAVLVVFIGTSNADLKKSGVSNGVIAGVSVGVIVGTVVVLALLGWSLLRPLQKQRERMEQKRRGLTESNQLKKTV